MEPTTVVDAWNHLLVQILVGVSSLVAVAVPYGVYLLKKWVDAKTKFIEDQQLRALIEHATTQVGVIAEATVAKINQRVKEIGKDGKLSEEEKAKLRATARVMVNKQIPEYMSKALSQGFADVNGYISSRIEQAVQTQKNLVPAKCD